MFKNLVGQCFDKTWILKSDLCPNLAALDRALTDVVLMLDIVWTDVVLGKTFDRDWTMI